jgi:hypothetical protein
MAQQPDEERLGWKRRLEKRDAVWVPVLLLAVFTLYGFALYSYAHSYDFLLRVRVPFVSAIW